MPFKLQIDQDIVGLLEHVVFCSLLTSRKFDALLLPMFNFTMSLISPTRPACCYTTSSIFTFKTRGIIGS